jgi:Trk K+ transport system NAD-binding subunit
VLGTGIDVDVLKSAGIETADAFAAVTNYDNTNIMACEVAKEIFHVKKVLARIYDPGREGMYHDLGLETVCPTTLISTTVHAILTGDGGSEAASGMSAASRNGLEALLAEASAEDASISGGATPPTYSKPPAKVEPVDEQRGTHDARGLRGLFRP